MSLDWESVVLAALVALLVREWFVLGWPGEVAEGGTAVGIDAAGSLVPAGDRQEATVSLLAPSVTPPGRRVGVGSTVPLDDAVPPGLTAAAGADTYRGDKT